MDRDLQILVNTPDRLVIDSPSDPVNMITLPIIVFVVAVILYVAYRVWSSSRIFSIGLIVVTLVIAAFVAANRGTSYQMEMDRRQDQLVMKTFRGKDRSKPTGTYVNPLDSVQRADIEFDRKYRRITLSMSNGEMIHPLGPDFEIMDSQFRALGAIQQFIGQAPTTQPAPQP